MLLALGAGASGEQIDWFVLSSSGTVSASSSSHRLGSSMSQLAVGPSSSSSHRCLAGFWQSFGGSTPGGCCVGQVGDANGSGDDVPTIGDISIIINALFTAGTCDGVLSCLPEADLNQSGAVAPVCDDITISDISILIDFLFIRLAYDPDSNPAGVQLAPCL